MNLNLPLAVRAFFEREVPRWIRIGLLVLVALIPIRYVARSYSPSTGFTSLIFFGKNFQARALPEIRSPAVSKETPWGYDGQFYAQIALDPALTRPELRKALDSPGYRARRIFVPLLAHLLGGGSPNAILQVYAVINVLFWILLAAGLNAFVRPMTPQALVGIVMILLTDGALFSVDRALIDLAATLFLFFAIHVPERWRGLTFGAALLTRETSLLGIGVLFDPAAVRSDPRRRKRLLLDLCIALLPFLLWLEYLKHVVFFTDSMGSEFFVWNLEGLTHALRESYRHWTTQYDWNFRPLAPVSLLVQALFLLTRPDLKSPYWRMGILLVPLLLLLPFHIFVEPEACTRPFLPLTLAFNVLLSRRRRPDYVVWLFLGNIGLLDDAYKMAFVG